jgi:hypothetical protein
MPDLLTHLIVAEGCRKATLSDALTYWFLVGTILPDMLTRPFNILFPSLYWFFVPLHTPVGLFFVCMAISQFFSTAERRSVFCNLLGGAALHLVLDLFQKHFGEGYYLLFPFSWHSFEIGLLWPETSLYLLPIWLGVGLWCGVKAFLRWRHKKTSLPSAGSLANMHDEVV